MDTNDLENTVGIVIKEYPYSESSKYIDLITPNLGIITVNVKGGRSIKNKFLSNTVLFTVSNFLLKKYYKNYYIVDAEYMDSFISKAIDFDKLVYAFYIIELLNKTLPKEQAHQNIYMMTATALKLLDNNVVDNDILILSYQLKLISMLGYHPVLSMCSACNDTEGPFKFSPDQNGLICKNCFSEAKIYYSISEEQIKILQNIIKIKFVELSKTNYNKNDILYLNKIISEYIKYEFNLSCFNSLKYDY